LIGGSSGQNGKEERDREERQTQQACQAHRWKTQPFEEERFAAQLKLAELPRNSSETRVRNRCSVTGRPRGYYRKFKLSRIALRALASSGQIPGMVKSSW